MNRIGLARIVAAIIVLLLVLMTAGCKGETSGATSPGNAIQDHFEAIKSKDCERVIYLMDYSAFAEQGITIDKEEEVQKCKEGYKRAQGEAVDNEVVGYKVLEEKIDGDRAEVKVDITMKSGNEEKTETVPLELKRGGGEWKILVGLR